MKIDKICLVLLMIVGLSLPSFAGEKHGKLIYAKMPTKILPEVSERDYAVYLPPSYDTDTLKSYPVLYLLHGGYGSFKDWPESGMLAYYADSLITLGATPEMIIVCPDGRYRDNTVWFNTNNWNAENHFFNEIIPYIDKTYRTAASGKYRAIAGLSLGGGATVSFALTHPDEFVAAYAMSSYHETIPSVMDETNNWLQPIVDTHTPYSLITTADNVTTNTWKKIAWFFDCGDKDYTFDTNIKLIDIFKQCGIPYEFRVRDGSHNWDYWKSALPLMLPFVGEQFNK